MRRFSFAAVVGILALFMSGSLFAQSQNQGEEQMQSRSAIEITRADIQSDRQALVASNLPLTDEQAKAFWPLYRQYRAEMQTVGDRLVNLIENYGQNYESLTDDERVLEDAEGQHRDQGKVHAALQQDTSLEDRHALLPDREQNGHDRHVGRGVPDPAGEVGARRAGAATRCSVIG